MIILDRMILKKRPWKHVRCWISLNSETVSLKTKTMSWKQLKQLQVMFPCEFITASVCFQITCFHFIHCEYESVALTIKHSTSTDLWGKKKPCHCGCDSFTAFWQAEISSKGKCHLSAAAWLFHVFLIVFGKQHRDISNIGMWFNSVRVTAG